MKKKKKTMTCQKKYYLRQNRIFLIMGLGWGSYGLTRPENMDMNMNMNGIGSGIVMSTRPRPRPLQIYFTVRNRISISISSSSSINIQNHNQQPLTPNKLFRTKLTRKNEEETKSEIKNHTYIYNTVNLIPNIYIFLYI